MALAADEDDLAVEAVVAQRLARPQPGQPGADDDHGPQCFGHLRRIEGRASPGGRSGGSLAAMTDVSIGNDPLAWPSADPELDALFASIVGTDEGRRDPYAGYAALRSAAPVYRSGLGMVICTRYAECEFVLRDPRFGKDERDRSEVIKERYGDLEIFPPEFLDMTRERRSLLFLNPPDHTRLRGLVSRAFTPRRVEELRPEILALVDGLLDALPDGEPVDAMEAIAYKLPVAVIGRMLGVPDTDFEQFREVMSRATILLEPIIDPNDLPPAIAAQQELEAYFLALVAKRRSEPGTDLLSGLIAVEEGSDRLTELELIGIAILLFGAGFETTTNLIGNGLLALLRHPDELARLRADPGLLRSGVDELLRYDSPVQFDGRHVLADAEIAGIPVAAGSEVITILGAANRDPEHFSDPDRLDVGRDEGPPMSFASGIHRCLGAALAQAEGQVFFGRLLERFSGVELADPEPTFRNRITLRGLEALPIVLHR